MRADALGLFWEDRPVVKKKKEAVKRTPPEAVWEREDYLPGLQEALDFNVPTITAADFNSPDGRRPRFVFDIEIYPNYFLIAFKNIETKNVFFVEWDDQCDDPGKLQFIHWMLTNVTLVSFNGINFDMPVTTLAINGVCTAGLKTAANDIISGAWRPQDILRRHKVRKLQGVDHIDLIEVAPLRANLKVYGGRCHTRKMQDLPFPHYKLLSREQKAIVRLYCVNDLDNTIDLYNTLKQALELREVMSSEYGMDLRSKSDAQIAEAVLGDAIMRRTGTVRIDKPIIPIGTVYRYNVPSFIRFQTPLLQRVLERARAAAYVVAESGAVGMPPELAALEIPIGGSVYRMGIGGLHSSESKVSYFSNSDYQLYDNDVESFYPKIKLILGLYPKHLGHAYLVEYNSIVQRRISAKERGDKVTADSLKITINGAYGKLGSPFSIFYAPDLLIQVTITGQLSLLMLIESLELAHIRVVSANTDGIVVYCHKSQREAMLAIFEDWRNRTGFKTEEKAYRSLHSRDVNSYIALKDDGDVKLKGAYANPWMDGVKNPAERLHKNPANTICIEAAVAYLRDRTPIAETILKCRDIRKFVSVRTVKSGAAKVWGDGRIDYLGKSLRWYYAAGVTGELVAVNSGNKVPRSDGAMPLPVLPQDFPTDADYNWYIEEAERILRDVGYTQ